LSFQRALQVRPNFAEAAYQLIDLDLSRGEVDKARETLDRFLAAFDATPDPLLMRARISCQQGDAVAKETFTRTLHLEFPASDPVRTLANIRPGR
jgi:Tfp pilus assembly protein PilF